MVDYDDGQTESTDGSQVFINYFENGSILSVFLGNSKADGPLISLTLLHKGSTEMV